MIAGEIEIRLLADIARLQRDMNRANQLVSNATAGMERAANAAKAALSGIASGLGGREIIQMADEYTKFTAQLKLATQSQREYGQAYAAVKQIASASQQDLGATGVLYARIANGTRELGVSQKQVADITNTVNMALKVSGATASESASAQLQLSQAFASGTLRGEEFNAVNEAAPRLMLALADGIGVPVGALKKMAEEGEITSKIMSDVLPKALADLQEEAKHVQTISGAFTELKNNTMEFVGTQAQANGVVSALTGGLSLLASNLTLVAGATLTIGAAKLGTMLGEWTASTYRQVAAASALRAANIASAEAEVAGNAAKLAQLGSTQAMVVVAREEAAAKLVSSNASIAAARTAIAAAEAAGAQSFALRTVRLATAELTVAEAQRSAMLAELAILGRQQVSVSAQLTAATAAQATAQAGLNAATSVGAGAAGLASRALGLLGGPLGAVITLLGLGATAWAVWGQKGAQAEKEIARTLAEETEDYIANLQKQIDKLNERNELAGKRMVSGAEPTSDHDKRREAIMAEINRISKDADLGVDAKTEMLRVWGGRLNQLTSDMEKLSAAQQKNKDITFDAKYADWLGKNGTAAQKEAHELAELRKEYGRVTPEMEKWVKAKHADKGAGQAAKQEATAYQNLVTSIREKIAANQLEQQGYNQLSESQQMTIKLDAAISTGKNKLSAEHVREARALIEQVRVQEASIKSKAQAVEFEKNYANAVGMTAGILADRVKDVETEAIRNEELARSYGLSKLAIEQVELARLEEQLAQRSSLGLTLDEIETLEKLIAAKKRNAAALGAMEQVDAANKAREEWKRAAESIEQSLTDALLRGFESGKSFGKNLIDTLKNMFGTLVLRPMIQATLAPVTGNLASMLPGGGQSPSGGLGSTAQAASSLYKMYQSSSSAGAAASAVGNGGAASGLNVAASVTQYMPMIATAVAAYYAGSAVAGGYKVGGTGLANVINSFGIVGGLVNRAFGMKDKKFADSSSLVGSIGSGGFAGTVDTAWKQEGGWFRSDKSGVNKATVDADMAKQLGAGYEALKLASADFAKTLGINADYIATRAQAVNIALGKDDAANQKAIEDFFVGVGNTIAGELLPSLGMFQKEGEGASATLQRLATGYALVDTALTSIGMTFGAVGTASLEARERLLSASGGLDAFAANTAGFQQNFLTEAERNAPVLKSVTDQLAALGLAGVDTRDEFKQVVLGLDLTTEAGAKQYGELMKMQAAFAQVYPVIEKTVDVVDDAAVRLAEVNKPYLDQITELERALMSAKDRRASEIQGMDASTVALYDHVAALRLEIETRDQAAARAQEVAAQAKSLQDEYDQLTMTRTQLLEKERNALDPSLRARWDEVQAIKATQEVLDRFSQSSADAVRQQEAARDAHQGLYAAIADGMQKARDAAKAMREFGQSLLLGDQSSLSTGAQYNLALEQLRTASPDNVQSAASAFLKASKERDEGSLAYARDFAMVQQLIERAAQSQDARVGQLEWFAKLVSGSAGLDGSHANGLDYVPFDGYRAELHRGERVQTAAEARGADATAAAVERLAGIVAGQQAAIDKTGRMTERLSNLMEGLSDGGNELRVKVVA